jgi:hypothetical protein
MTKKTKKAKKLIAVRIDRDILDRCERALATLDANGMPMQVTPLVRKSFHNAVERLEALAAKVTP